MIDHKYQALYYIFALVLISGSIFISYNDNNSISGNAINALNPQCGNKILDTGEQCDSGIIRGYAKIMFTCSDGKRYSTKGDCYYPNYLKDYASNICKSKTKSSQGLITYEFADECGIKTPVYCFQQSSAFLNKNSYIKCDYKNCTLDFSLCNPKGTCGNGVLEPGEKCDGQTGILCRTLNASSKNPSANVSCTSACNFDTTICGITTSKCGNGILEAGEVCDDNDNKTKYNSCEAFGKTGGQLICHNCKFNTSMCKNTSKECGDGIVELTEQCDDGNTINGDGCTSCKFDCTKDSDCGMEKCPLNFTIQKTCINNKCQLTRNCTLQTICADSDDGVNLNLRGNLDYRLTFNGTFGSYYNASFEDMCAIIDDPNYDGNNITDALGVKQYYADDCAGSNCYLIEYSCFKGEIYGTRNVDNFHINTTYCANSDTHACHLGSCEETSTQFCGDGIVEEEAGENCDTDSSLRCSDFESLVPWENPDGIVECNSCQWNLSICSQDNNVSTCGNGIIESGEECDGSLTYQQGVHAKLCSRHEINSSYCKDPFSTEFPPDFVLMYDEYVFQCKNDCKLHLECSGGCCGNGLVDTGESCDGADTFNTSCENYGMKSGGPVTCNQCQVNLNNCIPTESMCGNGILNTGETCDGPGTFSTVCEDYGLISGGEVTCKDNCELDLHNCLEANSSCTDSDGGNNIYSKGSTYGKRYSDSTIFDTEQDSCTTENLLTEYYCVGDLRVGDQQTCSNGCKDGACINETQLTTECTDSDNGIYYYTKGNVTVKTSINGHLDNTKTYRDTCYAPNPSYPDLLILNETSCKNGNVSITSTSCPFNCQEGTCVNVINTHSSSSGCSGVNLFTSNPIVTSKNSTAKSIKISSIYGVNISILLFSDKSFAVFSNSSFRKEWSVVFSGLTPGTNYDYIITLGNISNQKCQLTSTYYSSVNYGINISNMTFGVTEIRIHTGDSISWTNSDNMPHTVKSDSGSELNSTTLLPGNSYKHTFLTAGTYHYHCSIHPSMTGTVIVE